MLHVPREHAHEPAWEDERVAASDDVTTGKVFVVEYEQIKEEQRARVGFRDNLLYVTLAAMAAVVAAALQARAGANVLLLLPPVSVVLGWTYLVNDEKISAIGRYIREQLAPQLAVLTGEQDPIFGWEVAHRNDRRRVSRKYLQLAVDLATFCVAPLVAIVIYCVSGPTTLPFVAVSVIELLAIGVLAWQIAVYSDLREPGT